MNRRQSLLLFADALAQARTALARPIPTRRPFRMGVTRWPPDVTVAAAEAVERFIRDQCDMAAPMLFGGVPWPEAAQGLPFGADLASHLSWRPPAGHKLLVSINMIDDSGRTLAPYWGERESLPIPPPFRGRPFDDPLILRTYANYCLRVCRQTRPDWFAIGIELNSLLQNAPSRWSALKHLYRHAYEAVKTAFPQVKCCFTSEALHLLGLVTGADASVQRREVLDLLRFSDIVAFSVYPHMSLAIPRPLPAHFFDFAGNLAEAAGSKPIGISESGYTSRPVQIGTIRLLGSPQDQKHYLELLLAAASRDRYEFVVNFVSHDYRRLTASLPEPERTIALIWTYTGLVDGHGAAKLLTPTWRRYLAMPYGR